MSQWTHVAGIIRLDSMGANIIRADTSFKNGMIKEAVAKVLGKTCDFESGDKAWSQCGVPMGSEGSLQYRVHPNSEEDTHSLNWGYVAIWGDLRDFGMESVLKIQEWFQEGLEKLKKPEGFSAMKDMGAQEKAEYMLSSFMVRSAVLCIDVEYGPQVVLLHDERTQKVVSISPKP